MLVGPSMLEPFPEVSGLDVIFFLFPWAGFPWKSSPQWWHLTNCNKRRVESSFTILQYKGKMENSWQLKVALVTHFTMLWIMNKCKTEVFPHREIVSDTATTCLPHLCCMVFFDFLWGCYKRTRKAFDMNLSTPDIRNTRMFWLGPCTLSSSQSTWIQTWKQISQDPWEEPCLWTFDLGGVSQGCFGLEALRENLSGTRFLPRWPLAMGVLAQACRWLRLLFLLDFWRLRWSEGITPLTWIVLT